MSEIKLVNQKDAFDIIVSTVNKVVNTIKPTYGPAGNKVIISKVLNGMSPLVVDDGVQIARDLELPDPIENAVLKVIRETAIRTNDRVGDGTTSSLIMLQAIINEVAKSSNRDGRKIERELKKGLSEATDQLLLSAREITTEEELEKVARISYDDEKIAKVIAETWFKLGKDGVVTVDKSGTMETFAEVTDGVTIKNGFISPYMVTNPARMEAVVENPYILITDYRLTEANDVVPIMNELLKKEIRNLVIVADNIEGAALSTAIINKVQGVFNLVAVVAPANDRAVFLEDLAKMTGAKMFSHDKGNKLENAKVEDLGRAERFISKRESSVIIEPRGNKEEIAPAIENLKLAEAVETKESQKAEIRKRIAMFNNKVAVVKVGAATENEERALRYKVEDAINAVRAAYKSGVVMGAGRALGAIETSSPILNAALKYPAKQLLENMGIYEDSCPRGEALNVVTGKAGDFMEVGVVDPKDVLIAGVESAVSIAALLITTSGMIVEKPEHIKQQ